MAKVFRSQHVNHSNRYRTQNYLYSVTKSTSEESQSIEAKKDDGEEESSVETVTKMHHYPR